MRERLNWCYKLQQSKKKDKGLKEKYHLNKLILKDSRENKTQTIKVEK